MEQAMKAMVLRALREPLVPEERATPVPGPGEVVVRVEACAVCRTDLHVVDGDLPSPKLPLIPGHEIIGTVETAGADLPCWIGKRVGVPWLGRTCGRCAYCLSGSENLCDRPEFTGYTRDGGFATHVLAVADFTVDLNPEGDPVAMAPLLCAGLIGWRCLLKAGAAHRIGFYGFGAAAHIIAQICAFQGREVFAFTRPGDLDAQAFALRHGATWAGGSNQSPPAPLDAAIIFAPVGELVPLALGAVRKGGRVVCGGIHMSELPSMPYSLLWGERELVSVANLTRRDAASFFPEARRAGVRTRTTAYPLSAANEALVDLRLGRLQGAAVLVP